MTTVKTVMTRREDPGIEREHLTAKTVASEPDVQITTLPWYSMIGIRAGRSAIQTFLGVMSAGGVGIEAQVIPSDFPSLIILAAKLAGMSAMMATLWNGGELLTKLDISHPQLRA